MNLLIKIALRYSIIAISFVFLMFFILIALDKNPVIYISNIIFIGPLTAIFLFLCVKAFKDFNRFKLRFWEGFSVGLLFALSFCIMYGALLVVYGEFFDTQYFQEYRDLSVLRTEKQKEQFLQTFDEDAFHRAIEATSKASVFDISFILVRNCFFVAFMLTPIISLFMRTSEPKVK